jgi:outer membrane protein TolC
MIFLLVFFLPGISVAQTSWTASDIAACSVAQVGNLQKEAIYMRESEVSDRRANFYPSVTLSQSFGTLSSQSAEDRTTQTELAVDQKVLDFSGSSSVSAAEHRLNAANYEFNGSAMNNSIDIVHSLVIQQELQDRITADEKQLDGYNALLKILSAGDRIGSSDSNNLLQTKSSLLSLESDKQRAIFELSREENQFMTQFGFKPPKLSEVKSRQISSIDPDAFPNVRAAAESIREIEESTKELSRSSWPAVSLRGAYTASQINGQSTSTSPATEGTASVVIDLSGLWKNNGRKAGYSAIKSSRENVLKQEKINLKNRLQILDDELAAIEKRLPILKSQIEISEQSRSVTRAKMRLGKLTFLELQQTENSATEASLQYFSLMHRKDELLLTKELMSIFSLRRLEQRSCQASR